MTKETLRDDFKEKECFHCRAFSECQQSFENQTKCATLRIWSILNSKR